MKTFSFLCIFGLFMAGCATPSSFTSYIGEQQNWPTNSGAFVYRQFGLPIYTSWPERPYKVLGIVKASSDSAAAAEGLKQGADALILYDSKSIYTGERTSTSTYAWKSENNIFATTFGNHHPTYTTTRTYIVIQYTNFPFTAAERKQLNLP